MAEHDEHEKQTLKSYYELLRENRCFRVIWLGEVKIWSHSLWNSNNVIQIPAHLMASCKQKRLDVLCRQRLYRCLLTFLACLSCSLS